MELTYTCEKSEKETVALAMRPFRRYFRTMFAISAVMFVVAWAQAVAELMVEGLVAQGGVSLGIFLLFMSIAIAVTVWLRRRRFRRGVVEAYRKRKTNLAEYHLSDEGLFCAHGESKATMPWSEFAKYSIDSDALFLQCHSGNVNPEGFVAPVTPGRILFEAEGVPLEIAQEALRLGAQKLPITTKFIVRRASLSGSIIIPVLHSQKSIGSTSVIQNSRSPFLMRTHIGK